MIAGITLASMDNADPNRTDVMDRFSGYFYAWKRMTEVSTPTESASCQSIKLCDGGNAACSPARKYSKDLTEVLQSGTAADSDQDAITGMILAVKAVENDAQ